MDETDLLILSELCEDARKPYSTIANNIGISTQTVKRRYETLKKKHVILSSICIDSRKLGYTGITYLLMNTGSGNNLQNLVDTLKTMEGVILATKAVGEYECYAVMLFRDVNDFFEKMRRIQKISTLSNLNYAIAKNDWPQLPPIINVLRAHKDLIK